MSKAKFDAAKQLIREGQYAQARALLETIDHPQAKEWLQKLGDLESKADNPRAAKPKGSRRRGCLYIVVALTVISLVAFAGQQRGGSPLPVAAPTNTPGGPTATITNTPAPTATATMTATPGVEDQARSIMEAAAVGAKISRVSVIDVASPKLLSMDFDMFEGFNGYEVDFTARQMLKMACALYVNGFSDDWQYQFSAMVNLIDRSTGKTSTDDGLTTRVKSATVGGWNCANADQMDAAQAVDDYILSPLFR
jgi:hypothetical protein